MKSAAKAGMVVGGYVLAALIAFGVVALYVALTDTPDRQASIGIYAFGDSLLFLGVFGMAAALPTGAALYFLRPHPSFWRVLSVAGPAVVATGLAACVLYLMARGAPSASVLGAWANVAVLRILSGPLVVVALILSGVFAPGRSTRLTLLVAGGVEAALFARPRMLGSTKRNNGRR
jgi:hypothetical protein